MKEETTYHIPVLLMPSVDAMNIRPDGTYVDVTFGGGGHSREILSRLEDGGRLLSFDQDVDSVPMVAFTGNVPTSSIGRDGFQEAYIEGITVPITKHNFTVRRVEDLADTMRAAFRIAQSGRKGPVLVDIPKDVTAAVCEFTPKQPEPIRTVTTYNEEQVHWAADLINAAQRPLVYFGGGVRSAASCQPLRDLLHKAEIPATYTLMAAGVVPYGDPMNLGMLGMHGCYTSNRAVAECDVLIAVGTRFSDRVALNPKTFAKNATIIQIDIDASELGKNVDVDLSIVGDAAYVLNAMLPQIKPAKHPEWMTMIQLHLHHLCARFLC